MRPIASLSSRCWVSLWFLLLFGSVALLVFHALWPTGLVLLTSDDNVGLIAANQRVIEASPLAHWMGEALWGMPGLQGFHLWALAMGTLSAETFMNVYHGLCLALAGWLLALYLRDKGLRSAACVFGGLVAFWVGTNLTLTYAGHVGKYGLMVFLSLAVFALGRWGKTGRVEWSLVAGVAAGAMFLEQSDVALFCALLLAPVGVFEAARAAGSWQITALAKKSWGAALVATLLVGGASMSVVGAGVTEVPKGEDPAERWSYLTQWSQPPDESLDFIAPGWTGWRSGEETGPYWGKMGRSEGWETTRQGFQNFKLENVYVGVLPLLFALIAVAAAFRWRKEKNAATIALWGGLCVLALLLAFGKYFPLYRPLSLLPGFSSIRNPNKFIHFFQMAWGVLAAFGLDAALRMEGRTARKWIWGSGIVATVFLLSGLALWADLSTNAMGRVIQWNRAFSVTYAGGAFVLGAAVLWLLSQNVFHSVEKNFPQCGKKGAEFSTGGKKSSTVWKTFLRRLSAWGVWIPALVVVFDAAVILAPKYIQTMPPGYVAENDLVRYLKREVGFNRTAMATQDGFYNLWLTYLFPYHGISSVNVTQLPRPPADYTAFWSSVKDPVRGWRLAAVSHVLVHAQVAAQLMANPAWASQLERVWAYQPQNDGQGGVATPMVPAGRNAPELVLRLKPVPPRVAAVPSWRVVSDEEALRTLNDPSFQPYSSLLLPEGTKTSGPPSGDPGPLPVVTVSRLIPGRYEFTVENHGPTWVRVAEKFDPGWKATVDGKSVPVTRCDYMFQGLAFEEAGTHEVVLKYAPSSMPIVLQGAGLLVGLGAAVRLVAVRRRRQGEGAA